MPNLEEQEKIIREQWFQDHVAMINQYGPITVLSWKKSGTGIFAVRYLLDGSRLSVSGDIGDAIYQWNRDLTFEWLSDLNLGYFASKCLASESGRGYQEWDSEYLKKCIEFHFNAEDEGSKIRERWEKSYGEEAIYDGEFSWNFWLQTNGFDIFGDDWWDMGLDGKTTSIRCHGHLIGIKMAVEQLGSQGETDE